MVVADGGRHWYPRRFGIGRALDRCHRGDDRVRRGDPGSSAVARRRGPPRGGCSRCELRAAVRVRGFPWDRRSAPRSRTSHRGARALARHRSRAVRCSRARDGAHARGSGCARDLQRTAARATRTTITTTPRTASRNPRGGISRIFCGDRGLQLVARNRRAAARRVARRYVRDSRRHRGRRMAGTVRWRVPSRRRGPRTGRGGPRSGTSARRRGAVGTRGRGLYTARDLRHEPDRARGSERAPRAARGH